MRRIQRCMALGLCVGLVLLPVLAMLPLACTPTPDAPINPFVDFPAVALNGEPQPLMTNIAPLGELEKGTVLNIRLDGEGLEAALILLLDETTNEAGIIVGGGPPDEAFLYRIAEGGRYFVHARFAPDMAETAQRATLTIELSDEAYQPPTTQYVQVDFADGYLTEPGLVDPESFADDEIQLLTDLEEIVRQEVVTKLKEIFAGTPVSILGPDETAPDGPLSRLTYRPDRILPEGLDTFDAAIPAVDPDSPCAEVVLFGEVLPSRAGTDHGNARQDDEAVVYVGSFQGRGEECRTAVIESLNNIVLALSHTGAHEIGHLIGLYHVALVDIMDRRPTSAFQRQLGFERGQILIEVPVMRDDGSVDVETRVQTTILQDPQRYFDLNFAQ